MNYAHKLWGWNELRVKMEKYPTFVEGTSITIQQNDYPQPWLFSSSPIECDVSILSLEKMTVFLLHVVSHHSKLRRSEASEMPRACEVFHTMLEKVLNEPHLLYTTDGVMCLFNLLVLMFECCSFLVTPLNLLIETEGLQLPELVQRVRDIEVMLDKSCYGDNVIMALRAATENLLRIFEEKLEIVTQILNGYFKSRIIDVCYPGYDSDSYHFINIEDSIFERSFHIIKVGSNEKIIHLYKSANHVYSKQDAFDTLLSYPVNMDFSIDYDDHRLDCKTMAENLKILEDLKDAVRFYDRDFDSYIRILNEMLTQLWDRRVYLSKENDPNKYFSQSELEVIFAYLSKFLYDFELSNNQGDVASQYIDAFFFYLNSLSLFDVLPLLNTYQIAGVSSQCFKLLSNSESTSYSRVPLIRISSLLSKLSYLSTTTHYLAHGYRGFCFNTIEGSEKIIPVFETKILDSLISLTVPMQKTWRQILSSRELFKSDSTFDVIDPCYVCLEDITNEEFYVTSCGHVTCENCTEGILEHSQNK